MKSQLICSALMQIHHINNHNCNRIFQSFCTRVFLLWFHYISLSSILMFVSLLFFYLKERIKVPQLILLILLLWLLWLLCLPRRGLLLQQLIHGGFLILGCCLKRIWRMLFEWITCSCK